MKKMMILGVLALLFGGSRVVAQNCNYIVYPCYGTDESCLAFVAPEKVEWRCNYSHNCFFVTDELPSDAEVYPITVVRNLLTNEMLTESFVVDLDSLSVYRYSFMDLQKPNGVGNNVYFATPNSSHAYLGLRSSGEAMMRIEEQTSN